MNLNVGFHKLFHMRLILFALLAVFSLTPFSYAHMYETSTDIDTMMGQMMVNQGVSNVTQLNCGNISDDEFEELGDGVMEKMIGDPELHEQMDMMMGGEGSESLSQMHIAMGKNWLDCDGFQGMMGANMMPMMMRMVGSYHPAYYTGYNSLLIWTFVGWLLAVALGIILFLVWTGSIKLRKK